MVRRITVIQGHPDSKNHHFCHALADSYIKGARNSAFEVRLIDVASMDFPLLRSKDDFEHDTSVESIRQAQEAIRWADHLVIVYPLWLGTMPALLKAFFEQVLRPSFAFDYTEPARLPKKHLTGKSARIVVTMGMPAYIYRWFFFAHGVKTLERNILAFCGIKPIRTSLVGSIESRSEAQRKKWLSSMQQLGETGR
ncbi:Putative NADPH-quinone reductase (modulator of drug activity B) [Nitrosomonas marina]|uniref:Putative NADPH-quinone reductase (Modulator of drug activity B) n=1 Tax=Nitrosomonas marina TaxID=917 RepID=A0A1I0CU44_9PROT|nr:NAD(P)H-dependent oxidoreductase [Nitrosomonas marina]SET23263.1 Putative NADPH-quinone reductase (modulator of drug activity B) [Nitrosomonas marina]